MKYSPGSLILTRTDDGWLIEVLLNNTKSDEPVVAEIVCYIVHIVVSDFVANIQLDWPYFKWSLN